MTFAEKLHQRAAELRQAALAVRAAAHTTAGTYDGSKDLLHHATLIMREAGVMLRRARRVARSTQHGGSAT